MATIDYTIIYLQRNNTLFDFIIITKFRISIRQYCYVVGEAQYDFSYQGKNFPFGYLSLLQLGLSTCIKYVYQSKYTECFQNVEKCNILHYNCNVFWKMAVIIVYLILLVLMVIVELTVITIINNNLCGVEKCQVCLFCVSQLYSVCLVYYLYIGCNNKQMFNVTI